MCHQAMSAQEPASAKPPKMPAGVRLKLHHAIAKHLSLYGGRKYDLLREDPEFRPYIGKHLGETGDKRLDRAVKEVRASLPKRRPGVSGQHGTATLRSAGAGEATPEESVTQIFSAASASRIGFSELQSLIQERIPELKRHLAATQNEQGDLVSWQLYVKLSTELRQMTRTVAELGARFQAQLNTDEFLEGLDNCLAREFAAEPERFRELRGRINDLVAQCGGLPATGEQP
jgi:hypothetical protein